MEMPLWERLLIGVLALAAIFFFTPRVRQWFKDPPKAGKGDWPAVIWPLVLVSAFVMLLIYMVS